MSLTVLSGGLMSAVHGIYTRWQYFDAMVQMLLNHATLYLFLQG